MGSSPCPSLVRASGVATPVNAHVGGFMCAGVPQFSGATLSGTDGPTPDLADLFGEACVGCSTASTIPDRQRRLCDCAVFLASCLRKKKRRQTIGKHDSSGKTRRRSERYRRGRHHPQVVKCPNRLKRQLLLSSTPCPPRQDVTALLR